MTTLARARSTARSAGARVIPLRPAAPAPLPAPVERADKLHRSAMLATLFEAASPVSCHSRASLRPMWAEEAMHRASNMLELVLKLEAQSWTALAPASLEPEAALASTLAALFGALDITDDDAVAPTTGLLRDMVMTLVELFGPTVGQVSIVTNMQGLTLSAYRRRALVLAATELVTATLQDAFRGRSGGRIAAHLDCSADGHARFVLEDDGPGPRIPRGECGQDVVSGLAGILDADLVVRRSSLGGTLTELRFAV